MRHRITSTITVSHKGNHTMFRKRRKHKEKPPKMKEEVKNGELDSSSKTSSDDETEFKSTAHSNRNGFFHGVQSKQSGITQNVKVEVNIDQGEDTLDKIAGCLGRCFGKGAKAAAE